MGSLSDDPSTPAQRPRARSPIRSPISESLSPPTPAQRPQARPSVRSPISEFSPLTPPQRPRKGLTPVQGPQGLSSDIGDRQNEASSLAAAIRSSFHTPFSTVSDLTEEESEGDQMWESHHPTRNSKSTKNVVAEKKGKSSKPTKNVMVAKQLTEGKSRGTGLRKERGISVIPAQIHQLIDLTKDDVGESHLSSL